MAELVCNVRAMSQTIVAAVSTFGLFMAANWGTASLLDDIQWAFSFSLPQFLKCGTMQGNILSQILGHTMLSFVLPLVSYVWSVINASEVYEAKWGLLKTRGGSVKSMDHGSIAIITICPVYIRFPASALTCSTDEQQRRRSLEERDYQSVSLKEIAELCPLELRPCPAAPAAADNNNGNAIDSNTDNSTALIMNIDEEDSTQWMCYRVPDEKREKVVLLGLGLTPSYKELRFLRSRNRFQTIVTALQAVGYMLTVIQRAAHHLAISPLEAFVTFLCIITSIQLLLELYACGHYQCPILLRLNTQQFCRLRDDQVPPIEIDDLISDLGFIFLLFVPWLLILGLSMYYFVHYMHTYLICSISALLFFLAHCILAIVIITFHENPFIYVSSSLLAPFMKVLYYGLYTSSMIVALVSTIIDWKAFQEANQKPWYSWILPHLSS